MTSASTPNAAAGFQIRRARPDEVAEIARLQATAHAELYAPPELDREKYVADSLDRAHKNRHRWRGYLVAEASGRILGVTQVLFDRVVALYVDAAHRGCGVGAALLAAAEARLRNDGVGLAWLQVAEGYPAIQAFYERRGWRVEKTMPKEANPASSEWGLTVVALTKQVGEIDQFRHRVSGAVLKAALIFAAAAAIALALRGLYGTGAVDVPEAIAAGTVLGVLAANFLGRSVNFTARRTRWHAAVLAGVYVTLLLVAFSLAVIAWQATGLLAPGGGAIDLPGFPSIELHDPKRDQMRILLVMALSGAAALFARRATTWLWRRYWWLLD
jgi:GNAT superfamily N-acetyltransferase